MGDMIEAYKAFLRSKVVMADSIGFEIEDSDINPILKPFQRACIRWAVRMGRAALFESFGLGKTLQQLEIVRLILMMIQRTTGVEGMGLIVIPLGVRQEFMRDAAMLGITVKFIRRIEECDGPGIYLTNYETVRDGKLDPRNFIVGSLDEAAILRGFGGTRTFREFMATFAGDRKTMNDRVLTDGVKYRFVATATPSPNEYIELLAYSAFLGVMDIGNAKAQPLDAKILTPSGWKLMGDVQVGDHVIACDGSSTRVLGVYPQGDRPVFKVTFSDGASTECDAEHLWLTRTQYERNNEKRYIQRNGMDAPRVGQFATVKTTADIERTLVSSIGGKNHSIPIVAPVDFDQRTVTVSPWLLGALVGDACLRQTSIVFSTMDDWMVDRVSAELPRGLSLRTTGRGICDYGITGTGKKGGKGPGSNSLLNALRGYGLLGKRSWEKRLPDDYLFNSVEVRLEVLRGLMDTDGTVNGNGVPYFSTSSEQLAADVVFLVRSLGGVATVRTVKTTHRDAHLVLITMRGEMNPFSLPRKADKFSPKLKYPARRYITSVETVGTKPAQCIAIEHPSRLYVTDDFVVTHNTRFFKRNSEKADQLTIHPHKEREFWMWVASWGLFVQKPSDLGFSDDGYELPEMEINWHEIPADHTDAGFDFRGQGQLIKQQAIGVVDSAREKRESLPARIAKMMEIRAIDLDAHRIIWHDLEAERMAIEKAIPDVMSVYGSQDDDTKATRIIGFSEGEFRELAGKPVMLGSGCNFQRHCAWAIFLGIGFKFADFIQAVHRLHRFLQQKTVRIDLIYTEQEREVRRILEQKWQQHKDTVEQMTAIIKEFGLSSAAMADNLKRAMGVERIEVIGRNFRAINNDCVLEAANMADNSIDLGLTSIPFSTQYEYSPNYSDFGHSDNNAHFFEQMDFLTPNLLRVLKPGRIFAIHVKDRIVPGGMTGLGFQTVYPFHARCIEHYTKHGFGYLGMKTIVTDVVRENNQTYRLGWSEQCKDGTKMGVGMPEYLLLFRKPPSDTSNSYADEPVTKGKPDCADADGNVIPWVRGGNEVIGTGYSRARWQVDAHGFARSSGNRLLTPDELETLDHDIIFRWFRDYHLHNIYDFEHHVRIGETIDSFHRLPTTFMLLQPPSWMDDVWTDVARMRTLNMIQAQKGQEQHLCLARGSLVLTRDGYVPIEDVASGDEVLTHRGRWRKVLAARMTGKDREVVDLRAQGVAGLRLTPDHKLWARLAHGARAVDAATKSEPEWLPAEDSVGHYINIKLPPVEPSVLTKTECWLIGRWIADGHVGTRGDYWVSIGPDKLAAFEQHAGEHAGTRSVGTAVQIRLKSLSETMRSTLARCGRGASGKLIPAELLGLDGTLAQSVLAGYLSGDGHFIQSRRRWQASSVSRSLLLGISLLVQRVHGTVASIAPGRPSGQAVIQGRTVNTKQEWMLSFDDGSNEGRKRPFVLDDGAWKRVRSADSAGTSDVWCLKVEEDESFTAEGCIVKNCPLQFDIIDRVIEQFSMKGETLFDPFGGIMSVPFRAIKKGRKAIACELSSRYFMDGVQYCQAAEREMSMPSLFDSLDMPEAA